MAPALGAVYTLDERIADAVSLLTQASEQTTATDMIAMQVLCHLSLGETQLRAGYLEWAHTLAGPAMAPTRTHQEHSHQAYVLRLLGEIVARRDLLESDQAEAYYCQALILAEELGMQPL
jgi:hypothetical protein